MSLLGLAALDKSNYRRHDDEESGHFPGSAPIVD
jgi:hypothetical protein